MDLLASYASDDDGQEQDPPTCVGRRQQRKELPATVSSAADSPGPAVKRARTDDYKELRNVTGNIKGVAKDESYVEDQPRSQDTATAEVQQPQRIRAFPHVEGNFAAVVYVQVPEAVSQRVHSILALACAPSSRTLTAKLQPTQNSIACCPVELRSTCPCKACTPSCSPAAALINMNACSDPLSRQQPIKHQQQQQQQLQVDQQQHQLPLHMSLSRTVAIRHAQIQSLKSALHKQLRAFKAYHVKLSGLTCLVNENASRSFVCLKATSGLQQVLRMLGAVDKVFIKHGLPTFHQDPLPHVSLAWTPGDQTQQLQPWLDGVRHETVDMQVSKIVCQIGKAQHVVWEA